MSAPAAIAHWRAGIVQGVVPDGVDDLGPGYLDPELLPVTLLHDAYARALAEFGPAALAYGDDRGALPLRELIATRTGADPDHVVVTAGTSHALHLLATTLARPGDVVAADEIGYDLGRRIFADCGLRVRPITGDASGMTPEALHRALSQQRAAFVYLTPTFHNPTGHVVPEQRRRELLDVAAAHGTLIVEDDAYAELALRGPAVPPTFAQLAGHCGVVRLGTFSKTLAPGLRLGWLETEPAFADRLVAHGLFASGGALNHTTSLAVTVLLRNGDYDRRLTDLRAGLLTRQEALVSALPWPVDVPSGGFFLWLRFPGARERDLLRAADEARVRIAAGSRFGAVGQAAVRLACSATSPDRLRAAAARFAAHLEGVA